MIVIETRAPKIGFAIPAADFPWHLVPEPGSPGSRAFKVEIILRYEGVETRCVLGTGHLQSLKRGLDAAPGGTCVLQGRWAGDRLDAVSATYQPPKQTA